MPISTTPPADTERAISDEEWRELVRAADAWECAALRVLDAVQISENPPVVEPSESA